jgi:hypothetical protein
MEQQQPQQQQQPPAGVWRIPLAQLSRNPLEAQELAGVLQEATGVQVRLRRTGAWQHTAAAQGGHCSTEGAWQRAPSTNPPCSLYNR